MTLTPLSGGYKAASKTLGVRPLRTADRLDAPAVDPGGLGQAGGLVPGGEPLMSAVSGLRLPETTQQPNKTQQNHQ